MRGRLARVLRDAPAEAHVVEFEGSWWAWGRLRQVAAAVSAALAPYPPAARIGLVIENRPEHVAALLAVLTSDRCVVTLSPMQPRERLLADIQRSQVEVLLVSRAVLDSTDLLASKVAQVMVLQTDGGLVVTRDPVPTAGAISPGVCIEMLTSGTTGPPKRVHLTDRQLNTAMTAAGQLPRKGQMLANGVGLVVTPMVHISGLWGVLSQLHAGRRIVLFQRFDLLPWVEAVERHRPNAVGLVPTALRAVLDADVAPERLASLQVVICGTAPCPPALASAFQARYGARVLITYGATEFAGAVAGWTLPLHEAWWERKAGSVGRAYPGVRLRVVSSDGEELPPDTQGILEICTLQAARDDHSWVRTSDLASLDADGFLWIHGRADDAIIRGGFKVHPETVREALERHGAVREAAVVGLPDDRLGQVPVAAVELEPGADPPTEDELKAVCRERLTPYEVPTRVLVVDELPRTPSSKVSRVDLLELFQERADQGVA